MKEVETPKVTAQAHISETALPNSAASELFQKRWFCVGLYSSGKTFKQDAESPMPFLEIMNVQLITWVDYITDDPIRDLPLVALKWVSVKRLSLPCPAILRLIIRTLIRKCG